MLPFTLQQLRFFKALAIEENFTKAAESLKISQPYVSKEIKKLEKTLNLVLIHREKNKISLSESGKIFYEYSERILALCEESCKVLIDLENGERGNLIIGASQTIGIYFLPKVLAVFEQNYPQIAMNVEINSTRMIARNVIDREIDLAIVGGEIPDQLKKNLFIENFLEDEFSLIVSKLHPFASKKQILKQDLYQLNFITLNSTSPIQKLINNLLKKNQIETKQFKIIKQLNSIEGIKMAVSLGLGAAFVSSLAIEKEIELKTIEILTIENIRVNRSLSIISNAEYYKSKAFQIFYQELLQLKNQIKN